MPVVIVVNKVDRLKPGHIASQMKQAATLGNFHALHPVSAKTGDGIDELRADLISLLPEGPLLYPPETDTDMSLEARIAELVREQALRLARRRSCRTRSRPRSSRSRSKHVHVRLYTETESQKQILIGKGGRWCARSARPPASRSSRHGLPAAAGEGAPKWRRNETMLERLGLSARS